MNVVDASWARYTYSYLSGRLQVVPQLYRLHSRSERMAPYKLTVSASRTEVIRSFAGFDPTVRNITGLLPESLDQWAVFRTFHHPAMTYTKGWIAIAGAPWVASHHVASAGFGIEDSAVLSTLTAGAEKAFCELPRSKTRSDVIRTALLHYSVRREQCVQLVERVVF